MVSKVALLETLELPALILSDLWGNRYSNHIESAFFTTKCTKETQSPQSMYGAAWSSSVSEIRNAVRAATAHREADEREYHPLSWLAGMRECGQEGKPAYSKIPYSKDSVWEEILRLPCQAALEDGRAGGYSMSLEFLVLFFQEKSTEEVVTYNFFNQPTQITEGGYRIELSYGANQQRNMAKRYYDNVLESTRHYISKYYEKEISANNNTSLYCYIYGDNGVVAMRIVNSPVRLRL